MRVVFPQNFEINNLHEQYTVIEKLSCGPFSENFLVEDKHHEKFLAVVSTNSNLFLPSDIISLIKNKCKSILTPVGYSRTNFQNINFPVLLFNYYNGSLGSFIHDYELDSIDGTTRFNILFGVAMAMRHLHRNGRKYIFLNPYNIFLDSNFNPQLLFLGTSSIPTKDLVKSYLSTNPPLPLYLAPEILQHINDTDNYLITGKVDNYSFSLLAYYLTSLIIPYDQFITETPNDFIQKVINGHRPDIYSFPQVKTVVSMLQSAWDADPDDRVSFYEIASTMCMYPFFKLFEIDISEVTKYVLNFENIGGNFQTIFKYNDPNLTEEELLEVVERTGKSMNEVMMTSANIEGEKFNFKPLDDKDIDAQINLMMSVNGLKRRQNEIIYYFQVKETDDINRILEVAGFQRTNSIDDEKNSEKDAKKGDVNSSVFIG